MKKLFLACILAVGFLWGCASVAAAGLTGVAEATDPTGLRLVLYKEADRCQQNSPGWLRAALFHPDGKPTEYGCWASDGIYIFVKWDDGMKDVIDGSVFVPYGKPTKAPYVEDQKNRNHV